MVAGSSARTMRADRLPLVTLLPPRSAVLPEDFPQRLEHIKTISGLSWRELADKVGADQRQVARWRKGVEPTGGAMLALIEFSMVLPDGPRLIFGNSQAHRIAAGSH